MPRLTAEQWQSIRVCWEYDPAEPSYEVAASRVGKKYDFAPPKRQSVHERAKGEGWARRSSMSGLNAAAHRRADRLMDSVDASAPDAQPDAQTRHIPDGVSASPADPAAAMGARNEDIERRSLTIARHRKEWANIAILRNEALSIRITDPVRCSERMRQVKIAAEITAAQQAGERKAWSLDLALNVQDLQNLSDEALEAIAAGRIPR